MFGLQSVALARLDIQNRRGKKRDFLSGQGFVLKR